MQTKLLNPLIFCGMGVPGTGGEVGNCRIRSILRNDDGREIFLELIENKGKGHVSHVYYNDSDWDRGLNHSKGLSPLTHMEFEYTINGVLDFVNESLGCSFTYIEIVDNYPGADCVMCFSSDKKADHQDVKINISELDGLEPVRAYTHSKRYQVSYDIVQELISRNISPQDDYKKERLQESDYIVLFGFDDDGVINRMDLSSEGLGYVSFGSEDVQKIISLLKS